MKQNSPWVCTGFLNGICVVYFEGGGVTLCIFQVFWEGIVLLPNSKGDKCQYLPLFIGLAHQGKDIVFRFIVEYSSLRDFGPQVIGQFLYEEI